MAQPSDSISQTGVPSIQKTVDTDANDPEKEPNLIRISFGERERERQHHSMLYDSQQPFIYTNNIESCKPT